MSGVGIDLLEIERLERALERRPRLAERVFTDAERAYAASRARPGMHLAARFCAKEAVAKALGMTAWSWRDVEVVGTDAAPAGCALTGVDRGPRGRAGRARLGLADAHRHDGGRGRPAGTPRHANQELHLPRCALARSPLRRRRDARRRRLGDRAAGGALARPDGARRRGPGARDGRRRAGRGRSGWSSARATTAAMVSWSPVCCARTGTRWTCSRRPTSVSSKGTRSPTSSACRRPAASLSPPSG